MRPNGLLSHERGRGNFYELYQGLHSLPARRESLDHRRDRDLLGEKCCLDLIGDREPLRQAARTHRLARAKHPMDERS